MQTDRQKLAIITIAHGVNYGNKLQNYALEATLRQLGFEVETLKQKVSYLTLLHDLINKLRRPVESFKEIKPKRQRAAKFALFNKDYLSFARYSIARKTDIAKISGVYDYFVLGSDQVWNPYFRMYNRAAMFGYGLKPGQAVPYAPSFGVSSIPGAQRTQITKYLKALKYISVREKQGQEIVNELTGRKDTVHVLDPTLLLSADDYRVIASKPKDFGINKGKGYILTYFLGQAAGALRDDIQSTARANNLDVINLNDINDSVVYSYGPSEFLYLFDNASLVLTDSFHAAVFSIIFRRPFVVFDRSRDKEASMNSRIESLLDVTGLHDRYNIDLKSKKLFKPDYSAVSERLEKEQQKSLNYLKKALGVK